MKVLVVDDEQPARKKIISFLKKEKEKISISEAGNGNEAVEKIRKEKPDLVCLDIQMPGIDGFGVIEEIGTDKIPAVVFVTAYDQYAIDAFEVHAVDYLLKPFDEERFFKSYHRALERIRSNAEKTENIQLIIEQIKKEKKYLKRLLVNVGSRYFFINVVDISHISAEEKYINLHTEKGCYLIRETMNNIEAGLDPEKFVRVHRSFIVNVGHIKEMQPWSHGDFVIVLKNGEEIQMSRRYKDRLFK